MQFPPRMMVPVLALCAAGYAAAESAEPGGATQVTPSGHKDVDGAVVGYRGDRNGYYECADPPTEWDERTGKNVVWKTRTPNWCYGSPIVAGTKVFVMSEPGWKADFPVLACLDIHTGKILWQREVNHLTEAISDPQRREQIAAAWRSLLERMRTAFRLVHEQATCGQDKHEETAAKIKALGWSDSLKNGKFGNRTNAGGYGVLRGWGAGKLPGPDPKLGVTQRELSDVGLRLETFYGFGVNREGECFSTPCSDGAYVYVVAEQGAHACYDLNGEVKWLRWIRPTFNPGGHDDSICRSPVLCDGLFITDLHVDRDTGNRQTKERANAVIALDAATGKVVWQTVMPREGGREHGCGSSKVMDIGGERFLITTGHVVRVRDGANVLTCAYAAKEDPSNGQTEIATDDATDTLFYFPGSGQSSKSEVVAVRLKKEEGRLTETEVWRAVLTGKGGGHTLAVHRGKLYTGKDVIDIATGKVTAFGDSRTVPTRWLLAVAGGRLYGLRDQGGKQAAEKSTGVTSVFSLDGKLLATNALLAACEPGDMSDQQIETSGSPGWDGAHFSYSCPFTFAGNRMFVRSHDYVYCLGDPKAAFVPGATLKSAEKP